MIYQLLQTEAAPLADKLSADSLAIKKQAIVETIKTTPPDQLIQQLASEAVNFGLKVLAALLIYVIGAWIIQMVKNGMKKSFTRKKTEKTLASFSYSLVTILLWVIVIVITVGTLGINTSSLAALLAAGGMAIGMALSGTVQNFAGGIMILVFKPFKAGDFIEAQGFSGIVKEVNIVSTRLVTTDNRTIIIPNGALSNGNINNVSALPIRRIDLTVSVHYGSDAEAVKQALLEIAAGIPGILDSTTKGAADPFAAVSSLEASSVDFVYRCWVNAADYWPLRFQLTEAVYTQLPAKYGIKFPFAQMDIHIQN
ncbi:MAG: mechanosensitive ion channel family protein [Bacteroidales bacterium]|nr:mechanosensitive ion channel family protein [Bacteroidales bacterium]